MTTKRFATRDFKDEGTGRNFTAGQELTGLTNGELINYEHAGLAGDPPNAAPVQDNVTAKKAAKKAAKPTAIAAASAPASTDNAPDQVA